jgi:hypothetical protein
MEIIFRDSTRDVFLEKVPGSVQMALSDMDPEFFASDAKDETKKTKEEDNMVQKKKKKHIDELAKIPGWIPNEIFKGMSKEEVGKFTCPFQLRFNKCENMQCLYSHDRTAQK